MSGRLEGKVAVVTGAASGMGRAGAQAFAREGAEVVLTDINAEGAQAIVDGIAGDGGSAVSIPADVSSSEQVQALARDAVARFGRIDVLYHCAADVRFINHEDRRLTELPEEVWDRMIAIHLTGTFLLCKYVGRAMLERRSGSIILSATTDALIGCAGLDSYTAAKGGVVSVTRSLAAGLARDGIRVNAICPGFVTTESQMEWMADPERAATLDPLHLLPVATPEQIAPFAVYLASDESAITTGGVFPIDSGYMAFKANVDVMGAMQSGPPDPGDDA
jgi:NAD(P)-dependent dehydrogenase (short-subunit alcohol dehydrogenase family)